MYATWNETDQRWAFGIKGPGYVEITVNTHSALFAAQASGKGIARGDDGYPCIGEAVKLSINEHHALRTLQINQQCEAAVTGGFWSTALGRSYEYSSQMDDQLNLTGVILAGLDSLYACRDEQGLKEFRPHTAQEIRQVGDDFTAFKLQLLQKANRLKQLLDQALVAGDRAALESVTWEVEP
ncbi:hypothetical protein CCU68_22030 [Pseudomonas gingeri NCPPB 3146 = LMG 5327]|uniref:DUF4376 domain-containing protein n=2 Tax=Pseudomonas gingeri TaxID=117681 RepID=A0A7Y7Y1J3_9PSED|nr:hypothetical protein [Pseudomonas gingeri]NWC16209.1 hypothetical protein [Pseudomonas gingeri]PNQ90364.1 hypothetical protein CCU68_22030 [Pseudomonas gingeri NCPPB 3146 = LMG 5327]